MSAAAALKVPVLVFQLTALCILVLALDFFLLGGHGIHFLSLVTCLFKTSYSATYNYLSILR